MELKDLLLPIAGLAGGAYAFALGLYFRLVARLDELTKRVVNHQAHAIKELEERVTKLEGDK